MKVQAIILGPVHETYHICEQYYVYLRLFHLTLKEPRKNASEKIVCLSRLLQIIA